MALLVGAGSGDSVAVVTDGELSGSNRGITIGQVIPEAAADGPLAVVAEGESIALTSRSEVSNFGERLRDYSPDEQMESSEARPEAGMAQVAQPISRGRC